MFAMVDGYARVAVAWDGVRLWWSLRCAMSDHVCCATKQQEQRWNWKDKLSLWNRADCEMIRTKWCRSQALSSIVREQQARPSSDFISRGGERPVSCYEAW